jgi:hypothetical protein
MPGDGFTFAVLVTGQPNGFILCSLLQFGGYLGFIGAYFVFRPDT